VTERRSSIIHPGRVKVAVGRFVKWPIAADRREGAARASRPALRVTSPADALRHVVGALACSKLDDACVGKLPFAERIFFHDRFDLRAAFAQDQDDATVVRNLAPGDEKMAGGEVKWVPRA
jgi:hypothetical protein